MKKLFAIVIVTLLSVKVLGQRFNMVVLTGYGAKESFYYATGDNILILVSRDGTITEYGIEFPKEFYGYYPGRLNKYNGRVDYYSENDNEAFRGKIKYIGMNLITYYGSYDEAGLQGKVKSIGATQIDYYSSYQDAAFKGCIKTAGGISFSYFSSFDNEAIRGRLKNIGNTQFTWYTSYDDKALKGKVKSIDTYAFTYYTSYETIHGSSGQMKSGFGSKYINGINYFVRN